MPAYYICIRCSRAVDRCLTRIAAGRRAAHVGTTVSIPQQDRAVLHTVPLKGARSLHTGRWRPVGTHAQQSARQSCNQVACLATTDSPVARASASPVADSSNNQTATMPASEHRPLNPLQVPVLVEADRSPLEIWHRMLALPAFQATSLPEAIEHGFRRAPELKRAFRLFVKTALVAPTAQNQDSNNYTPRFPDLEEIITTFQKRGLYQYYILADVLNLGRPQLANQVLASEWGGHDVKGRRDGRKRFLERMKAGSEALIEDTDQPLLLGSEPHVGQEVSSDEKAVAILSRVLSAWRQTLGSPQHTPFSQSPSEPWQGLPSAEEVRMIQGTNVPYMQRFSQLFGGRLDRRLESKVAADSAWVYLCYEILHRRGCISAEQVAAWQPWIALMSQLLGPMRTSNKSYIQSLLASASTLVSKADIYAIVRLWQGVESKPARTTSHPPRPEVTDLSTSENAQKWRSSVSNAMQRHNERRALSLWLDFKTVCTTWAASEDVAAVLAEFLWAFAHFKNAEMVVQVWQLLRSTGTVPSTSHWEAMIEAAKQTRDLASLEGLWQEMLKAGVTPTNRMWTAYLAALLKLRAPKSALSAVAAMGEQWQAAPTAAGSPADQGPSMIPLNAAISGLLDLDRREYVDALFRMADAHGLRPDVGTYNILLRGAVQGADPAAVRRIFADMKATGCEPDVITFTICINDLLRYVAEPGEPGEQATISMPSSEATDSLDATTIGSNGQQAAVLRLFADMADAGLTPAPHTYTTLLKTLLNGPSPNVPAAQAVLQQMASAGVPARSHAYTILLEHYLTRAPPDWAAVTRLRARATLEHPPLDTRFWGRLVQATADASDESSSAGATNGNHDALLAALRDAHTAHIPLGRLRIGTLAAALARLAHERDWTNAQALVRQVEPELAQRSRRSSAGGDAAERAAERRWATLVQQLRAEGLVEPAARTSGVLRPVYS